MSPLPEFGDALLPFFAGACCEKAPTEMKISKTDARQHRRAGWISGPQFENTHERLCIRLDITGIRPLPRLAVDAATENCILRFFIRVALCRYRIVRITNRLMNLRLCFASLICFSNASRWQRIP